MNQKISKCDKCAKNSVWQEYTGKKYCETHFLEIIEKRIRKHLRINKLINIKEQQHLIKDKQQKHLITQYFLEKIFKNRIKIKIITESQNKNNIIKSNTLDDEAEQLLKYFSNNQQPNNKEIKPISVITDEEVKTIAKILNINLKIISKNHEELTKKDPQILFSLKKSKEFIDERKNLKNK